MTASDVKADEKEASASELAEFQQDFLDFDLNKDDQIDPQEVRQQFKGDLDAQELHQFFIDVDKDLSGAISLGEYVDYAVTLNGGGAAGSEASETLNSDGTAGSEASETLNSDGAAGSEASEADAK
ncbi:unnamed protein product [Polarella glacialis]|uniref:EF-hand domain-containing protein n=1 Tax=Polarella glacialis TaxID=89957 RepID=A0A813JDX3_POLGL|nr:unnamed protein product [Polarella glacialis]